MKKRVAKNTRTIYHRGDYPGTFDTITFGHMDIMERYSGLVEELVVAVHKNIRKAPLFSIEERLELVREATSHIPNITVISFDELLVNFLKKQEIHLVIRGLRGIEDYGHELQMAHANNNLGGVETIFLVASQDVSFVSSTIIKEVASFGGDVSPFVPRCVVKALKQRQKQKTQGGKT